MGSPVLLYYHRLFFSVAGLIYGILGRGLKQSVVAAIAIFLIVGAYGMRRALGVVTDSKLLCIAGSIGFLFTNYVFTDWLVPRGDPSELSALMIVPWLLFWCLNLVRRKQVSLSLIPVIVLLVFAHSAIALTCLFTLAVALIVFVAVVGINGLLAVLGRLGICFVATALLLSPLLLAQLRFSDAYDPATKNETVAPVSSEFVGFGRYLVDASHRWFAGFQIPPFSNYVQIDYAIWVPLAAALVVGVVRGSVIWSRRSKQPRGARRDSENVVRLWIADRPVAVYLLGSLAVYLFLQLRASFFVYRLLSPLQVINFPWRMLAFITPIGIVLVVVIADGLMRTHPGKALWGGLAAAWVGSLILLSPVVPFTSGVATSFYPISTFTAPKSIDYRTFRGYFTTADYPPGSLYTVFLPRVFTPNGNEITSSATGSLYTRLHGSQAGAQSLTDVPCRVLGPTDAPLETLQLTFSVDCAGATRLALPVSYNGSSSIFVEGSRGQLLQIPYGHAPTDPRLIIHVPRSGKETVVVHLPTLWGTLF